LPKRRPRRHGAHARPDPEPAALTDADPSASAGFEADAGAILGNGESDQGGAARDGTGQDGADAWVWDSETDERWRAAQAVFEGSGPTSYTTAGLPRRRSGRQLVPGSAAAPEVARTTGRDPAEVRGRLNSFQDGLRRGRHRTAQATESTDDAVEGR
jgi:hypothetical protein